MSYATKIGKQEQDQRTYENVAEARRAHLVDSAGTEIAVGGGTQYTEDAAAAANPIGNAQILVRQDTPAALVTTDGDNVARRGTDYGAAYSQIVDSAGNFIDTFGGAGGTSSTDDSAFTAGTSLGTPAMGFFSADVVDANDVGVLAMDASRRLLVSLEVDNAGIGGGTQYAVDTALGATPTGTLGIGIRDDALSTLTPVEGDAIGLRVDSAGALWSRKYKSHTLIDSGNSTTTPLIGDAVFTGTGVDCLGCAAVTVQLASDVDSATDGMQFQFSINNSDWDESHDFTFDFSADGSRTFQFPVHAQYFRVVYTNGSGGQTYFRMQTLLHADNQLTSIHRVGDTITTDRSAQLVKAVLAGETTAGGGSMVNVKVNPSGTLEVNATQSGTWDINDISGTISLPTGASTSANQTTIIGHVDGIEGLLTTIDADTSIIAGDTSSMDGKMTVGAGTEAAALRVTLATDSTGLLSVDDNGGSLTVDGTFWQATQPVSGTFFQATQPISAASLPLPTGASTLAEQQTQTTHLSEIEGAVETLELTKATISATDLLRVGIFDDSDAQITTFGGGTQYVEDAAAAANPTGTAQILVRQDSPAGLTTTDGDNVARRGTDYGAAFSQILDSSGNFVDTFGGGTQYATNAIAPDPATGTAGLMERDDIIATLTPVEGDWVRMRSSAEGALWTQDFNSDALLADTNTIAGAVSGSEMQVDVVTSALPTGASTLAEQQTQTTHLSEIEGAVETLELTKATVSATDLLRVGIFDDSDAQITTFGGGTQYTEDGIVPANPIGTAMMMERDDALGGITPAAGDWTHPFANANGALWVKHDGSQAVTGTFFQATQPISAVSLPLPTGASTSAAQLPDGHNVTIDNGAAGAAVNIQDGGNTITVDGTVAATQSGTWNITNVSGTVSLPTGAATAAKQLADGHNVTVDNASLDVQGNIAHDTADSGDPVKIGGKARTTNITSVADGDRVNATFDDQGRQVITIGQPRDLIVQNTVNVSTTGETTILAAGAAGVFHDLTLLTYSNNSNQKVKATFKDSTAGTTRHIGTLAAGGGGAVFSLLRPFKQTTAANNWTVTLDGAYSVDFTVQAEANV